MLVGHATVSSQMGVDRAHNEDAWLVDEEMGLFVIADGLGGHAHGEVASGLAVRAVAESWRSARALVDAIGRGEQPTRAGTELLAEAVRRAHRAVRHRATTLEQAAGMGTTLTAAALVNEVVLFAHVGDTRLYRVGRDAVTQLTDDHTETASLVRAGKLDADAAHHHPDRHILVRAVGTDRIVDVDVGTAPIAGGDRLVLLSDGVIDPIEEALSTLLRHEDAPDALVAAAVNAGTEDDATGIVVDVREGEVRVVPVRTSVFEPNDNAR